MNKEEALQASDTALQELATALRQGKSDSLLHYLSMLSRFHRYSFSNCMLISLQKPDATLVAGFQRWKSLGRFVKRNERGIALLAPMISRPKTESADEADSAESTVRVLRGFRVVHVFDVSQTEGRELASFASLAGDPGDWLPRLEGLVASHGIRLEYPEVVLQNANGASFGGLIHVSSRLPMAQKLSTLAHELAHELLHQGADQRPSSKAVLETEAEAVAWVVCRACGLDCSTRAADYIQLWDGDEQTLLQSLERIRRVASGMLEHLSTPPDKSQPVSVTATWPAPRVAATAVVTTAAASALPAAANTDAAEPLYCTVLPQPGDLIQVQTSDWEVLEAGDWLRVCEPSVAAVDENLLRVAPRQRVSTMWGPLQGLPDGTQPEVMHTTGGPFRTLQITDLEELEYRGRGIDVFWCWRGAPQEGQRRDRPLRVGLWSCGRLRSEQQAAVRIVNGGV